MSRQLILVVLALGLYSRLSSGCSCFPTQLNTTYFNSYYTRVVSATVLKSSTHGSSITYTLKTNKVYKGCPQMVFKASTSVSSATCGVTLSTGTKYIIPLADQTKTFSISLCDVRLNIILYANLLLPVTLYLSIKR